MKQIIQYIASYGFAIPILLIIYLINPFNFGYIAGLAVIPFLLINKQFLKSSLDFDVFLLTIFSFSYALFYSLDATENQGNQYIFIYALTPPTFYLLGKYLSKELQSERLITLFLFILFTLFSISALISVFSAFLSEGFGTFERNIPMFWSGRRVSATIMGAYLVFNMCIPAILISSIGRHKLWIQILMLFVFAISLISVIRLGSRTQLAVFLITAIISLIYVMPKQSFRNNFILVLLLGSVVYYVQTMVSFDLSEDWLTNFADRMDSKGGDLSSGGGRTERWSKSIENIFTKPTGWNVKDFGYSHNLWLDVARVSGVLPFTLLLLITFRFISHIREFVRSNSNDLAIRTHILIYTLGFLLVFMVEPIFDGIFSLFTLFCLFVGLLRNASNLNLLQS